LSWKLSFLILSWFTKFSMTSKSIMTRRLCLCELNFTHTFMKMWLTTSFFSIQPCKTKTMFTNLDFFSHIWDSFCWVKSSTSIVHNFFCFSCNKSFRLCAYSTKDSFEKMYSRNVKRNCVISAWFNRRD
jgi:hypothetical protein